MKIRKENRRSFIVTLTMALLMAITLMGCASKEAAEEIKKTEVTDVKEEVATEAAEVEEAELTPTPTPEPTTEPTPEPTPEPIVYEGVDMESTLPGAEWMNTFEGIIEEPKFVVFNDSINKKVIVANEHKVEFSQGDSLSIYTPNNLSVVLMEGDSIDGTMYYSPLCTHVMLGEFKNENLISVKFLDANGELSSISCTIVP